jgi:uncharacterized protein YyaL (SSP411 family)
MTDNPEWEKKAEAIIQSTSEMVQRTPTSFTQLLQAHLREQSGGFEIVIAGKAENDKTQQILHELHELYVPHKVAILNDPDDAEIRQIAPFTEDQPLKNEKPTIYVCQNYACRQPTHEVDEMKAFLSP